MAKKSPTTVKSNQFPTSHSNQNKSGVSNAGLNKTIARKPRGV